MQDLKDDAIKNNLTILWFGPKRYAVFRKIKSGLPTATADLSTLSLFLYHKQTGAWKPALLKQKMFKKMKERHAGFCKRDKIGCTSLSSQLSIYRYRSLTTICVSCFRNVI